MSKNFTTNSSTGSSIDSSTSSNTGSDSLKDTGEISAPVSRRSFIKLGGMAGLAGLTMVAGSGLSACFGGDNSPQQGAGADSGKSPASSSPRTVLNADGTTITLPAEVTKVAAVFGPSYERVVVVGAEDRIVCNGDFHIQGWPWSNTVYEYLNEVPGIPNAHSDLNVEDLVAMGVQLVFCFPNPQQADAITNGGMVAVREVTTGKARDIVESIKLYASIFNDQTALAQAHAYEQYFDETFAMVKARTANVTKRPKVYLAYSSLLRAYGKKSDMVEIIDAAGGVLASLELEGGTNVEIPAEQIIQWDPDHIFVDHAGSSGNASAEDVIASVLASGEFNNISAVKNHSVHATPTGVFFWDAGVQKILYLVYIAKTIHPDLFKDIDLNAMLIDFYKKFYFYDLTNTQAARILNRENPA